MKKTTGELIERSYKEALAESTNFFGIFNNLYRILKAKYNEVDKEDKEIFQKFLETLKFNYGILDEDKEEKEYATT